MTAYVDCLRRFFCRHPSLSQVSNTNKYTCDRCGRWFGHYYNRRSRKLIKRRTT